MVRSRFGLSRPTFAWVAVILTATFATALIWSHYRLFWVDELLEFYTDSKPTVGAIFWGQLHAPFSLEPPLFHLLLHFMLRIIPWSPELAARLLSILSLLVTEVCAFAVTRRLARRDAAAILAMLLPFLLTSIDYAAEARIYSLQLATLATGILCFQSIVLGDFRWRWRIGLAVSLALSVLTHYYGVVVVMPVVIAEIVRSAQQRRPDWKTIGAIVLGIGCAVLDLPFVRGLTSIRAHYYGAREWSKWWIPFTYLWLKYHFATYTTLLDHGRDLFALVLGLLLMFGCAVAAISAMRRYRREQFSVAVALAVATALPILNIVLAHVVKAYQPRYSLPAVFGISVLTALLLAELLNDSMANALAVVLLAWCLVYAFGQIRTFRALRNQMVEAGLTPAQARVLASLQDKHIYVQNDSKYLVLHRYKSEPFVGLDSASCEMAWQGRNSDSLFSENMKHTAHIPFESFSRIDSGAEPHMLLIFQDNSNEWIGQELAADKAEVTMLGGAFGGQLALARFVHGQTCER